MEKRLNKDYSDPQAVYPKALKPKIQELLAWDRRMLRKVINPAKRKKRGDD